MNKIRVVSILFLACLTAFAQKPEVVVQMGHLNAIKSLCISHNGNFVISGGGYDGLIKIWDIQTGKEIKTLNTLNSSDIMIYCLSLTSDDKYLLSNGVDTESILLWDLTTGKLIKTYKGHTKSVTSITLTSDNKYFISASWDSTIKLWDFSTGDEIRTFKGHKGAVSSIAITNDGKYIISGSNDETIKVWDISTGKELNTLSGHRSFVSTVCLTPDDKYIISGSWDNSIKLWDLNTGKETGTFTGHKSLVESICITSDGKYLVSGSNDNTIKVWDINSYENIFTFSGHSDKISQVAITKNDKYIISASYDNTLKLWDFINRKEIRTFSGQASIISSIGLTSDNKFILSGSEDSTVKLWDLPSGEKINTFRGHEDGVTSVCITPNNKYAISGSIDNTAKLWEISTGKGKREYSGHFKAVNTVYMNPLGVYFASGSQDGSVKIWDINTQKQLLSIDMQYYSYVNAVCITPDGKNVLAGTLEDIFYMWDVKTGKELKKFTGHSGPVSSIRVSPNAKYVISGSYDSTIILWDLNSAKKIRTFLGHNDAISEVSFSYDGKYFASGCYNGVIKLWDINKAKEIISFINHKNIISSVVFTSDNKYLMSGSIDGTLKLWDLANGKEIVSMISMGRNDYITITPDNYYHCSKNGMSAIAFVLNEKVFSPEQFDLQFNRPDIVLERIGYADPEIIKAYREAYYKRLKKMNFKEEMFNEDFHLPEIEVVNKNMPISTYNKEIIFAVKSNDTQYKLDRLNVFVNDVPAYGMAGINLRDRLLNNFDTTLSIELLDGKNKIQVSCLNDKGVESLKESFEITYNGPPLESKTYYVGIGVANYQDSKLNLKYSVKDVQDMAAAFGSKGNSDITTLTNEQATRENILALKDKLMQTSVDDEVIISFSGHGFLSKDYDFYFATYDIDYKNPELRGISYDELENLLDGIPARKKLLLIDACHSGEIDKDEIEIKQTENIADNVKGFEIEITDKDSKLGLKNSFELMQELFANLSRGSGSVVISAAGGKEYAFEGNEWNNGVFTYCVLKGLKEKEADLDKNGTITVNELKNYVSEQVEKLTGGRQKPTSRSENLEFDFKVW